MDKWEPRDVECSECLLAAKAKAYFILVSLTTDPPDTEYVAAAYLRSLEGNVLRLKTPAPWLICLKGLINTTRTADPDDEEELAKRGRLRPVVHSSALLRLLRDSHDPIVSMYAQMENLFPRTYDLNFLTPQ